MRPSELLRQLNESDEGRRIEAKRASEVGKSLMETVSAFSNTAGLEGGYLLLGVSQSQGDLFETRYVVEGVPDPDKVASDLATQCATMFNERVRPVIEREEVDGRVLIAAYVPEAPAEQKPIYIESRGPHKGTYVRVGPTDQRCTDAELTRLYQDRSVRPFDGTLLPETTAADASPTALANYRRARRERDPDAPELALDDADLLRALRAVRPDGGGALRFTVAGLLLFGREEVLRDYFPMARVDYIRVQGRTWVRSAEDQFTSLDLYGPIFETVYRLEAAIMDDLPARFTLPEGSLHRVDVPLLPRTVVREALVNALMHRDYRTASPVQIIRYSNRIEFRNAGYSLKPEEELGRPGSELRNPGLAHVLHQTRLAETKGTGITTMRDAMREGDLTPPTFVSNREQNRFVATLLMLHVLAPETVAWLAHFDALGLSREDRQALVFVRETGTITNEDYRNLNGVDTLTASSALRRLRDLDLLEQQDKGAATFYTPTALVWGAGQEGGTENPTVKAESETPEVEGQTLGVGPETFEVEAETSRVGGQTSQVGGQTSRVGGEIGSGAGEAEEGESRKMLAGLLPEKLREDVVSLGRKASHNDIRDLILRVCRVRAWSGRELATLFDRSRDDFVRTHLRPMVRRGLLQRTQPNLNAPNQTYRTPDDHAG